MNPNAQNVDTIQCWNEVLTPKWLQFRHLLSGNGKIHSDAALSTIAVPAGSDVLDIGCGFGESCLELGDLVGPNGSVVGLDCTRDFLEIAETERLEAGVGNVSYQLADVETAELPESRYDIAFSRFGIMFCASPVRALRNIGHSLRPGGQLHLICWRSVGANPCWSDAEQIALRFLPPAPEDVADTCGPGPFSFADRDTNLRVLAASGFAQASLRRIDAPICVGRSVEEAVDYQLTVGPAGFVIRQAKEAGQEQLPHIRQALAEHLARHTRPDGSVWLRSSTWLISARRQLARPKRRLAPYLSAVLALG